MHSCRCLGWMLLAVMSSAEGFVAHSSAFAASTASTMAGRSWAPQVLPGGCHGASRFIAPNLRSGVTALRMSSGSEEEGKKGGLFGTGGFLGMFGGGGSTEERDAVVAQLTREEGWDMKMTIGSEPARALGGTGSLAKGDSMTVQIGVSFRLELDDGFDPPQGTAFVQDSSIFKETSEGGEMKGFWQVTDVVDGEVPSTVSLSFKCPDGISVSGQDVISPGFLYANVRVKKNQGAAGVKMYDGRLTVKEDVKTAFLLTAYNSIIAEYKLVGTCEASPRKKPSSLPPGA